MARGDHADSIVRWWPVRASNCEAFYASNCGASFFTGVVANAKFSAINRINYLNSIC
jgi:hypothetical protein